MFAFILLFLNFALTSKNRQMNYCRTNRRRLPVVNFNGQRRSQIFTNRFVSNCMCATFTEQSTQLLQTLFTGTTEKESAMTNAILDFFYRSLCQKYTEWKSCFLIESFENSQKPNIGFRYLPFHYPFCESDEHGHLWRTHPHWKQHHTQSLSENTRTWNLNCKCKIQSSNLGFWMGMGVLM